MKVVTGVNPPDISENSLTSSDQDGVIVEGMAKNRAAVALGRRRAETAEPGEMSEIGRKGGTAGGPARAQKLSAKRRKAIAKKAAAARWGKK